MHTAQPPTTFASSPPARPLALPLVGASYPQVLRTPRHRWWNPVVSWVVALLLGGAAVVLPMLFYLGGVFVLGGDDAVAGLDPQMADAPSTFVLNLSLALLIGVALLAVAIGHPVASRFLHSVEGRVRWGWLGRCLMLLLPLWLIYIVSAWVVDGTRTLGREDGWIALLLMALFMTPLQAAGEEYLFRGFVMVSIGAWFRRPIVGLVISGVVSSAVFAAAHGSGDPWIIVNLVGMSVACVYLTWRTGGLEAAIAIHVVNNVVVGVFGVLTGTSAESYIDASTRSTPLEALVGVAVMALATLILLRAADRAGISRTVPPAVGARP